MIYDLENVCLLKAVHRLALLIVVHQNHLLAVHIQKISPADDAHIVIFLVRDRKIAVSETRHDLSCFLDRRLEIEGHHVLRHGKMPDRRRHGHEARSGIGVIVRLHDGAPSVLRPLQQNFRNGGVHAHHKTGCAVVNRAHLRLVPVRNHHQIPRLHQLRHCLRARPYVKMPLGDHPVRIPDQHPAIQYLQQVLVACLRLAQDCRVEQFHVRVGNILQRDQPLKLSFLIGNTQRIDMPVIHPLPGGAAAHLPVHARLLPDVDVPDVRTHIDREPWRLHAKMIQHKGGFLADLTRAPRLVRLAADLIFQICIGNRGADRIRVRILVPDHADNPLR